MAFFSIPMELTFHTVVTVEAGSAADAVRKAKEEVDFLDDGISGAALVDWEVRGAAVEQ